jgi:hypothetical protein
MERYPCRARYKSGVEGGRGCFGGDSSLRLLAGVSCGVMGCKVVVVHCLRGGMRVVANAHFLSKNLSYESEVDVW